MLLRRWSCRCVRAKSTPAARAGDLTVPTSRAPREDGKLVLAVDSHRSASSPHARCCLDGISRLHGRVPPPSSPHARCCLDDHQQQPQGSSSSRRDLPPARPRPAPSLPPASPHARCCLDHHHLLPRVAVWITLGRAAFARVCANSRRPHARSTTSARRTSSHTHIRTR